VARLVCEKPAPCTLTAGLATWQCCRGTTWRPTPPPTTTTSSRKSGCVMTRIALISCSTPLHTMRHSFKVVMRLEQVYWCIGWRIFCTLPTQTPPTTTTTTFPPTMRSCLKRFFLECFFHECFFLISWLDSLFLVSCLFLPWLLLRVPPLGCSCVLPPLVCSCQTLVLAPSHSLAMASVWARS